MSEEQAAAAPAPAVEGTTPGGEVSKNIYDYRQTRDLVYILD